MNIFKSKKKNKEAPGKVAIELITDSGNGFYSWSAIYTEATL